MSDEQLSPREQLAYPFLETAVRIDTAAQMSGEPERLTQALADNVALWLYFKEVQLPTVPQVAADTIVMVAQISEFVVRAARLLEAQADTELLSRLVSLNLHMCEILLDAPGDE